MSDNKYFVQNIDTCNQKVIMLVALSSSEVVEDCYCDNLQTREISRKVVDLEKETWPAIHQKACTITLVLLDLECPGNQQQLASLSQ